MRFFKSDNTAAVSQEILAAISDANHGAALAYGTDQWSERMQSVFGEILRNPGTRICGVLRHGCELAGHRHLVSALGHGAHSRRGAHRARRMWCAGVFHRWRQAVAGGRRWREDRAPRTSSARLGLVRAARAWRAAAHVVHHAGHRTRRGVHARRDSRAGRHRPCRQMAVHMDGARFANAVGRAERVAGRADAGRSGVDVLSFGVIKNGGMNTEAVVFFDPDTRRGLRVPPQARRATGLQGALRFGATHWRTSRAGYGVAMPNTRIGWRRASPRPRRSGSACRSRPTRCS